MRIGSYSAIGGGGIQADGGTFTNAVGGDISINRSSGTGITNLATFINAGTVSIGMSGSIGGNALANAGTFSNSACATLNIGDNLLNTNLLTNAGFFTVSTTQSHTNTGTLTNDGVISYPQGNPIPNVINNDVLVAPFSSCGTASTTALQIGGANNFSAGTTWYTDAALTTAGGTYNAATNTFTPSGLSVGAHTLYFTATDNTNSCAQTLAVSLTVNALPTPTLVASGSINCTQTSVTLTAGGGVSYTFADASGTLGTPGSVSTLVVSAGGTYSVTVGNANGCVSSNTATITQSGVYTVTIANASGCISTTTLSVTAIPATSLVNGPVAGSVVCVGASVLVPVSATGSANLTYAWYRNGSLTGQTSATLSLLAAQITDAGSYSVVVTGACGSVTSTAFSLTVNPNPTVAISANPPSLTISSVQTATFTASGADTYNWSNLASTTAIQVSVGGTYSVTGTTNGCSSTTSVV